jgi:PEP-CTERM motif-containing protein
MIKSLVILSLLLASSTSALADSEKFDAVTDFSASTNPNGPWSYLFSGSLFTTRACPLAPGIECWWNGGSIPNSPTISKNVTGVPIRENGSVVLPPGELNMDPEADPVTVRWTAPDAGSWTITGFFSGLDAVSPAHAAEVILNSSSTLFATTIDSPGEASHFTFTLTLNAGDLIDFNVNPANDGFFLGTGFDATISNGPAAPTPEPASWGLLSLGLASLAAVLFRLRSNSRTQSI